MANTAITRPPANLCSRASNRMPVVLTLLAISALIAYVDRANLSVAAPLLKDELRISPSQLGILLSSFFWSYTLLNFGCGWVVDRFGDCLMLALGYAVWSLVTVATGFARGMVALFVMRLLLGAGQSAMFPAYSKILARCVPEQQRGVANGILMAALRWGSAGIALGGGFLVTRYGWRILFIGVGAIGLLWLPLWVKWAPPGGTRHHSSSSSRNFGRVLRQPHFWGASLGQFCGNYNLYFIVTWLPFYLVRGRNLSMHDMAKMAGLYYLVDSLSAIATGFISDRCIRRGMSVTVVRKTAMAGGWMTAAIGLAGWSWTDSHSYLAWLLLAAVGCGVGCAGVFSIAQTLAGPATAGTWTGLQNGFGNLAGILAPVITGYTLGGTGNFRLALLITSSVSLCSAVCWLFLVGEIKEVDWSKPVRLKATSGGLFRPEPDSPPAIAGE